MATDVGDYIDQLDELAKGIREYVEIARADYRDSRIAAVYKHMARAIEKQVQIDSLLRHKIEEMEQRLDG